MSSEAEPVQSPGKVGGPTLDSRACWTSVFEYVGGDDAAQAMTASKSGGGQHWTKGDAVAGLRCRIEESTDGGNIMSKHCNEDGVELRHIAPKLAYCLDNNLMHRRSDGIYTCTFVDDDHEGGLPTSANIKFDDDGRFSFMTFAIEDEDSEARTRMKVRFTQLHWFYDMGLFYTDRGRHDSDFTSPTRLMRLRFVMDDDSTASYLSREGWLNKDGSLTVEQGANAAGTSHVYTFSAVKKCSPE